MKTPTKTLVTSALFGLALSGCSGGSSSTGADIQQQADNIQMTVDQIQENQIEPIMDSGPVEFPDFDPPEFQEFDDPPSFL